MTNEKKEINDLSVFAEKWAYMSVSLLLNNSNSIDLYKNKNRDLICIKDDNEDIPINQLLAIIKNVCHVENVILKIKEIDRYNELVNYLSNFIDLGINVFVSFDNKEYTINDMCKIVTPYAIIVNPSINEKNITTVDKENRKNLDFIVTHSFSLLDSSIMSHEEFLRYIDIIVNYINENTNNDYEKVVLLSEIIKNSFEYDLNCKEESHYAESLLKYKKGVCNAISSFAEVILNHPDINIKTNVISNEDHAWNEVFINDEWYCCDFTQNMCPLSYNNFKLYTLITKTFNYFIDKVDSKMYKKIVRNYLEKINPKREILVSKPTTPKYRYGSYNSETGYERLGFEKYSELDSIMLYKYYNEIKDVDTNLTNIINMYTNEEDYNNNFKM